MKTNLLLHICATVLLCGMPVFSAEPVVDFDGKNTDRKDVKTFFTENNPVLIPGAANGTVSEFIIRREILSESGEWAELRPIKSWVGENGALKNQYSFLPNHAARWTLKCLKGNWTAKHTYTLRPDQLGGHYHYDTPPPSLLVSSVSLSASTAPFHSALSPIIFQEMNGNTTYYYWQRYPVFSTRIVERFDFYGACQGNTQTDFINVEVPGLSELPYGDNYFLDNSQDAMGFHPDVHYGSQKLIDTLMTVANEYKAAFPNAERIGI